MFFDAIGFDLDGTLWDSCEATAHAWAQTLDGTNLKKPTVADIRGIMGLTSAEIAKRLFPELDVGTGLKLLAKCCENQARYISKHGGDLYNNLEETLNLLSKTYKLFIVSNCQDGYIDCFLKYHKLEKYFCDYECIGRSGFSKCENIRLVMKRNNLKSALYVGDTDGDYKAAVCAGAQFIHAAYGFGKISTDVTKIAKISDLPAAVEQSTNIVR